VPSGVRVQLPPWRQLAHKWLILLKTTRNVAHFSLYLSSILVVIEPQQSIYI